MHLGFFCLCCASPTLDCEFAVIKCVHNLREGNFLRQVSLSLASLSNLKLDWSSAEEEKNFLWGKSFSALLLASQTKTRSETFSSYWRSYERLVIIREEEESEQCVKSLAEVMRWLKIGAVHDDCGNLRLRLVRRRRRSISSLENVQVESLSRNLEIFRRDCEPFDLLKSLSRWLTKG